MSNKRELFFAHIYRRLFTSTSTNKFTYRQPKPRGFGNLLDILNAGLIFRMHVCEKRHTMIVTKHLYPGALPLMLKNNNIYWQ
ncbi:hypothetical protein CI610_03537 [invertebrate metagenome]|uniref:Uncharacterized protein n=1 Tax=invertebrate metagenome TaxID=1711999 RepID=A0A2H9T2X1_9ZZZZ